MSVSNMVESASSNDSDLVDIFDRVGNLREATARLTTSVGSDFRNARAHCYEP